MERKSTRGGILANVKERTFSGYGAAYSTDLGGDRIIPGAFNSTLLDFYAGKAYVPLVDQHNYGSVRNVLGVMVEAEERTSGLWAKFSVVDSPDGDELLARIKMGAVTGLSIGYRVVDSERVQENGKSIRLLKDVRLHEISAVIYPMNPDAQIHTESVKRGMVAPGGAWFPHDWSSPKGIAPNDPRRIKLEADILKLESAQRDAQIRELEMWVLENT